jgi:hypothetical protein
LSGFYDAWIRLGSFEESKKFNYKHRATMFGYKQRSRRLATTDNNLVPLTPAGIPGAPPGLLPRCKRWSQNLFLSFHKLRMTRANKNGFACFASLHNPAPFFLHHLFTPGQMA